MSFLPSVGDRVWFYMLRSHVCGGHIQQCECNYPLGQKGPRGFSGNTVSRPAKVLDVSPEGLLELEVELTAEDEEIYGFARRQTRVLRSLPSSGTWTWRGSFGKRMEGEKA